MFDFLWNGVVDTVTLQFLSPFWFWLAVGIAASIAATAAGWYFSFLRPFAGILVLVITGGLYGYRKGEKDAEQRAAERAEKEKKRNSQEFTWWP